MDEKIIKNKWGKISSEANVKLKELYTPMQIDYCEMKLEECLGNWPLNICHRHRRWWYIKRPELLSTLGQTIIGCQHCHDKIDSNEKLLQKVFNKLRGPEIL